ncbi:MAG: hypothetical protein SFV23_21920 [Planctomycetaceae bacterium]|nr:hypothetical protein [Planctomycetaceae bacterium]
MAPVVTDWMRSMGLTVKPEFHLPWGICDLVGVSLNGDRVAHRLELKQREAIGSITSAAILLQIPDIETRRSASIESLFRQYSGVMLKSEVEAVVDRLVAGHFVQRTRGGRLRKINGWLPLEDRLMAVELKLFRIDEAMQQAKDHLEFATESYAAFPLDVAAKVTSQSWRWSRYLDAGVGVVSVDQEKCEVVLSPRNLREPVDAAIRAYSVEKFWRTRTKDKTS